MYGQKAWDIAGYTFQGENYCPGCIIDQLPTGPGQPYDGWALDPGVFAPVEDNLDEIAIAFGIDRNDETTFDSGDFPKVIFSPWWRIPNTVDLAGANCERRTRNELGAKQ